MNALLRKEVRLLLPSFAAALLLSLGVWLIPNRLTGQDEWRTFLTIFPFLLCPAMAVMLALDSFGREISSGTLTHLLAQPVARDKIWWTKVSLLAGALLTVLVVWLVSFRLHMWNFVANNLQVADATDWKRTMLTVPIMFTVVIFSGGLWTVLLLRQVAAAFWFTLIAPGAVMMLVALVMQKQPEMIPKTLIAALLLYAVAGFGFARWLFLRAQDLKPSGGEIALPSARSWGVWNLGRARVSERRWRPGLALWRKEVQLHHAQFVLAGALLLLHLAALAARQFVVESEWPAWHFVLHAFWVLWLFMGLLIGCAAVAEERKFGTLEGQLCLPVRRRRQFTIKFVVAMLLSLLFGAVMPVILEGGRILPNFDRNLNDFYLLSPGGPLFPLGETISLVLPFLALAGLVALVGLMSFYASTLARNTLQALGPALLGLLLVTIIWVAALYPEGWLGIRLWRGPLAHWIGTPVFAVMLVGLMYWNFKRVLVGWPVWRRNLSVLVVTMALVTTATASIYHRSWEFLLAKEPPHGPSLLDRSMNVKLRLEGWRPLVELPDGRIWVGRLGQWSSDGILVARAEDFSGAYLDGTNWTKVIATHHDLMGLKKDGSLWVTEESERVPGSPTNHSPINIRMVRVGADNDWTNIVAHQFQTALLLKANGTLWEMGSNRWNTNQPFPGLRAFTPSQLGTSSDWSDFSVQSGRTFLHQRDGQFWASPKYSSVETNTLTLRPGLTLFRAPELDPTVSPSMHTAWKFGSVWVGVRPDGTLRALGNRAFVNRGLKRGAQETDTAIGTENNWRAVAGNSFDVVVTLKADGTLWKWEFPEDPAVRPDLAIATLLSTHSDWAALAAGWSGTFSLARDGSLWLWQFPSSYQQRSLIAPSQRPQRLGNIFETANR